MVLFPVVFQLVCVACKRSIKESTFKRDIFRHSKTCRQRQPGCAEANELVFECTHCKFLATDRRKATTHQASHFGDESYNLAQYPCAQCKRFFATQKALSSHTRQCKSNVVPSARDTPATEDVSAAQISLLVPKTSIDGSTSGPVGLVRDEVVDVAIPSTETARVSCQSNQCELSFDSVSSGSLGPDVDLYAMPIDADPNFDCDQWLKKLIPPKTTKKNQMHPKNNLASSKLTAREMQALYAKQPKKALDKLQFIPNISCKVDPIDLRHCLLLQLQSQNPPQLTSQLWHTCLGVNL